MRLPSSFACQRALTPKRGSRSYIGLRNDDCDVAAAAVEYEPGRATCSASCPDPAVTLLLDLPGADYVQASYRDRLDTICCLEYGVPHLPSNGFALFSKVVPKDVSLVTAILSVDVLNAATPIVIAVIVFGWLMYLIERRDNNSQFHAQHSGVYFASVSLATFGFGDVAPVTRMGRVLTIFWCVMSVMSISALTSVISARLTVDQLAYTTIDSLSQLRPSDLCVENAYPAVEGFVSDEYALGGDLAGAGVMLGTPQDCAEAVLSGKVLAYLTDRPLLLWLAYEYLSTGSLYVSPTIRANPLTLAYPSGSTLRPLADAAVIRMTTNTAWSTARQRLETAWFPQGSASSPGRAQQINMPTLVAACVLVLAWLLGMLVSVGRKALRATKAGHALSSVSNVLLSRLTGRKAGDGEAAAGNDDAAAAQMDGQETAGWTKGGGASPHIDVLLL